MNFKKMALKGHTQFKSFKLSMEVFNLKQNLQFKVY